MNEIELEIVVAGVMYPGWTEQAARDRLGATDIEVTDAYHRYFAGKVARWAEELRNCVAGRPGLLKVSGWQEKRRIAQRAAGGNVSDADLAYAEKEALRRGKSEDPLALIVLWGQKSDRLTSVQFEIDGIESAVIDAIKQSPAYGDMNTTYTTLTRDHEKEILSDHLI